MGECDLVLLRAPALDLDIHVRTTIRREYSFISTAALRIGDDVLTVSSWGDFAINGVHGAQGKEAMSIGGFPVSQAQFNKKHTRLEVSLGGGNDEKLVLSTFKDLVSVTIHQGRAENFQTSSGMMGSFHGQLLGRDGKTIFEDMDMFGQEWQVRGDEPKLFETSREPQYPKQCRLPSESVATTRRLGEGIARSKAEAACAHFADENRKKACVFDVMAVGDVDIAKAGGY